MSGWYDDGSEEQERAMQNARLGKRNHDPLWDRSENTCVACGKECWSRAGKTPQHDPVSSCCKARFDSFTRSAQTVSEKP